MMICLDRNNLDELEKIAKQKYPNDKIWFVKCLSCNGLWKYWKKENGDFGHGCSNSDCFPFSWRDN